MTKYALCIGINDYPGTNNDLSGCVNDANDWATELESRGFTVSKLINGEATKAAMVSGMSGLLEKAHSGDTVVVTYSGHGTWEFDEDGDEPDNRDEALCPWDLDKGPLLDDTLFDIFAQRNKGVRLIFLSDSCHSGTVAKLYIEKGEPRRVKFLAPETYHGNDPAKMKRLKMVERTRATGRARSGALLISGCLDLEYSYDTSFQGRPNGAFTRVALDVLRDAKPATYREWYTAIRKRLPSSAYPQTPNLVATSSQKKWKVLE